MMNAEGERSTPASVEMMCHYRQRIAAMAETSGLQWRELKDARQNQRNAGSQRNELADRDRGHCGARDGFSY